MPTDPMTYFAAVVLLGWLVVALELMHGNRQLRRLATLRAPAPTRWPRVSVVFTARNEGATLGTAVPTMLALDYPDLEFILVDDRSEDDSGVILEKFAAVDPRVKVIHVAELPPGWLGKTHGLQCGGEQATGEWILFTDADIHFTPPVLQKAVAYARAQSLDHLAAVPVLQESRDLLAVCVSAFSLLFALFVRPWRVPNPSSHCHGGIGAFNLVRASTYRKMGGHAPLRLRPDDDLKLGKLMKAGGFSEIVLGVDAISVAWYDSVRGLVGGLEKNAFAGADYRIWLVGVGLLLHAVCVFWPLAAVFIATDVARWLWLGAVAVMLGVAADNHRFDGGRAWHGLLFPVGLVVIDYAIVRSMVLTLWRRGIVWRGTHYPLHDLKANKL
ncbi:MAG: glycosyltransferase [Lacunisphaera sp.]|nr:glycosyltransferase [Lacunisphaera sp.]